MKSYGVPGKVPQVVLSRGDFAAAKAAMVYIHGGAHELWSHVLDALSRGEKVVVDGVYYVLESKACSYEE